MKYTTIRIEGSILSSDILDKLEQGELGGQRPEDFNFESRIKVKDEIARAWADAHDLWRIFNRQRERLGDKVTGTSETRKYWILPLLGLLGYDAEVARAEEISGKSYAISHRTAKLDGFPIHIMGFNDSLDKKREDSGPRMSPHALVQEYINITEHLYAVVTNGIYLRLLRDSSRLVKLSFIEFDLQSMMEEEHFADFAIMYRLIHASRMPIRQDGGAESLIEKYHQDALDSGSRIREGLSEAVENSIKSLAEGFLNHSANNELREAIESDRLPHFTFYQYHLRLIYRLLFLMVIEERNIIYPSNADQRKVRIYYDYYSIGHLRRHCEKVHLLERGSSDLWIAMKNTFRIFEKEYYGQQLDIKPLGGELFSPNAIGILNNCNLDNSVLLECLKNLTVFTNKNNNQKMRVNYASLNVEEFGSVYEGLLEYDPLVEKQNSHWRFLFIKGEGRSASGSHYTPDELVQPLIKHSLDYIIEEKLKEPDKEKALLSIRVCDVASGSGHILLNAARRIGTELAKVRTGEDQPSPTAFREAVRDVIRTCIYGVDKNPLAVELCKIALWLEAHNPGGPLNFLDHHIKCGDSIVGLAHMEELQKGIAEEAFKRLPDDDKDICADLRKTNKAERSGMLKFDFEGAVGGKVKDILTDFKGFSELPEQTPAEIEEKRKAYIRLTSGEGWRRLKTLADIQVAQFFIPKNKETQVKIITEGLYRQYLAGEKQLLGQEVAMAEAVASRKGFFHWFLEFPEVFAEGGFDCILGNPPFLGNRKLSGSYGDAFLECIKYEFAPIGAVDLVTYFFRRIFGIIKRGGFQSLISTNTIAQGNAREDGLDVIVKQGGVINHAIKSMKWPGKAAVEVALVSITKQNWKGKFVLAGKTVKTITPYLDDAETLGNPYPLKQNENKSFQGSIVFGKGFVLTPQEAEKLIERNPKNRDVLFPYLNGEDLNSQPDQSASRWVINFSDWPIEKAKDYEDCFSIIEEKVKLERNSKGGEIAAAPWWQFWRIRDDLYRTIAQMDRVLVHTRVTKTHAFIYVKSNSVFSDATIVFAIPHFSVLQSNFHEHWAWIYSSSMKGDRRYAPTDCFETFPFPQHLNSEQKAKLEAIGEGYNEHRRHLMLSLQVGLTKTYNLFHEKDLSIANIEKVSKQPNGVCEKGYQDILKLRELHVEMDNAVLAAYVWSDLNLAHDFYEVDYPPQNDRIRFTISPEARREVLKRLLKLNHEIHEQEVKAGLWEKKKVVKRKAIKPEETIMPLLPEFDISVLTATSYPSTEKDKAICAAALAIVAQSDGLSSMDHLDALLLASHPEWCKMILEANDHAGFKKALTSTSKELFVTAEDSIRWKDCRDYLEQRTAIVVDHARKDQSISEGNDLQNVRATFYQDTDEVVKYALKALKRIRSDREDVLISQELKNILISINQQHKLYALVA
ncbi:MAG: Eco57I restriction-modification methylase domain-containing protein [Thermodesulfovibrionales bacterium]